MTTNVHYYGMLAEKLGISTESLTIEIDRDQFDLQHYFESKYPELKDMSFKIAVDQELTNSIAKNYVPSEIALLPPFAGG
jgi:sulfur-carrier protein